MDLAAHLADMFNILIKMFLKEKIKNKGQGASPPTETDMKKAHVSSEDSTESSWLGTEKAVLLA